MSDGRHPTPGCVDAETLAAFIDGRLEPRERAAVEAHLADCADCYEVWMEVARAADKPPATSLDAPWKGWIPAAVAAIILLAVGTIWVYSRTPVDRTEIAVTRLAQAIGTNRTVLPRITGGFQYGRAPRSRRSDTVPETTLAVEEAVVAIRRLATDERSAGSLAALGVAYLVTGRLDDSIAALSEASGLSPDNSRIHLDLAAAYLERWRIEGESEDATRALHEARVALESDSQSPTAMFNHALALEAVGLSEAAIEAWEAFVRQHPQDPWVAEARQRQAALQRSAPSTTPAVEDDIRGDHDDALARRASDSPLSLYRFLEASLAQVDRQGSASDALVRRVGTALISSGRDRLLPELAAKLEAMRGASSRVRTCLTEMLHARAEAMRAFDDGRYTVAEAKLGEAATAAGCAGTEVMDLELLRLQLAFFAHRNTEVIPELHAMKMHAQSAGYWRVLGRINHVVGLHAFREGRTSDALAAYRDGLVAYQQAGDDDLGSVLRVLLAELLNEMGESRAAWREFSLALRGLPHVDAFRRRFTILVAAATACQQAGMHGAALVFADLMIREGVTSANAVAAVGGHLHRARAVSALRNPTSALADLDAAEAARLRISDALVREQYAADVAWTTGLTLAEVAPGRAIAALNLAYDFYRRTGFSSRLAEILLARGRAHQVLGRRVEAEHDWQAGIDVLEGQRAGIVQEDLRASRIAKLWELYGLLIHSKANRPEEALVVLERSRSRVLLDRLTSTGAQPETTRSLFNWLPSGVTVVAYTALPRSLLVFVITAETVAVDERPVSSATLAGLVRDVNGNQNASREESRRQLGRWLLPGGVVFADNSTTVFLPDGPLHSVPFGALQLPDGSGYLVEVTTPLVSPSLTLLRRMSGTSVTRSPHVVLVAADSTIPGLPVLRAAAGEVDAISRVYGVAAMQGPITTTGLAQSLRAATVFHFSGHATSDANRPGRSALVLATGASMTTDDIASTRLAPASTVVLAACSTARGTTPRGEGPMSLARAFLAAGASAVVASVVDINDGASTQVLVALHTQLHKHGNQARALALAQREAIARQEPPETWAPFNVIGGIRTER